MEEEESKTSQILAPHVSVSRVLGKWTPERASVNDSVKQLTFSSCSHITCTCYSLLGLRWETEASSAVAQKNMKLCPSSQAWCPVVGAWLVVPCGTGRAGIVMVETRDSLAESQVAGCEGPSKRWIARQIQIVGVRDLIMCFTGSRCSTFD